MCASSSSSAEDVRPWPMDHAADVIASDRGRTTGSLRDYCRTCTGSATLRRRQRQARREPAAPRATVSRSGALQARPRPAPRAAASRVRTDCSLTWRRTSPTSSPAFSAGLPSARRSPPAMPAEGAPRARPARLRLSQDETELGGRRVPRRPPAAWPPAGPAAAGAPPRRRTVSRTSLLDGGRGDQPLEQARLGHRPLLEGDDDVAVLHPGPGGRRVLHDLDDDDAEALADPVARRRARPSPARTGPGSARRATPTAARRPPPPPRSEEQPATSSASGRERSLAAALQLARRAPQRVADAVEARVDVRASPAGSWRRSASGRTAAATRSATTPGAPGPSASAVSSRSAGRSSASQQRATGGADAARARAHVAGGSTSSSGRRARRAGRACRSAARCSSRTRALAPHAGCCSGRSPAARSSRSRPRPATGCTAGLPA